MGSTKKRGYLRLFVLVVLLIIFGLVLATYKVLSPKIRPVNTQPEKTHSTVQKLEKANLQPSTQITNEDTSIQGTEKSSHCIFLGPVRTTDSTESSNEDYASFSGQYEVLSNSGEALLDTKYGSETSSSFNPRVSEAKWELGKLYTSLPTKEPKVLLTIDDGPGNYTEEILDFLKKYNIKAIFFVSGDTVKGYADVLKREYEEGHEIGTHTYCHRSFYKLEKTSSVEEMKQILISDLDKTEKNIKDIIPEAKIRFLRMPEGYYRDWVGEIAMKYGYVTMNWSVAGDWFDKPDEEIIKMFKSAIKPGAIILLHDGRNRGKRALKILEEIVPYILSQGYSFADPKEFF